MILKSKLLIQIILILVILIVNMCYGEIKMIQATIRHANRYPVEKEWSLKYYPNDPYINYTWAPYGPMKLTKKGKLNAYKLGEFFQSQYKKLLGPSHKANEVFFGALDLSRTINTARLIASGIYPEFHRKRNQSSDPIFAPVNVNVSGSSLYYPMAYCENYFIDRQKSNLEVNRLLEVFNNLEKFSNYLAVHTTVRHPPSVHSWFLYNQFVAQIDLGLKLKPWTESIFPNGKLLKMCAIEYILQTYTDRMKRLLGGVWIKSFLDDVDNFVNNINVDRKASFFVASEIHVAAILNTLGVYKPHVPSYLSSVLFELHKIRKEYYVKVIHRNEGTSTDLKIPGCDKSLCLLRKFKKVLKNVTLEDFHKDCGNRGIFPII